MTAPQTDFHRFSQSASENEALQKTLQMRGDRLSRIPSVPSVLNALLAELAQPPEEVNLLRVADILARDESLAARCLRVANSPLFALRNRVDSLRGAVRTLGIAHTREVAVSSTMAGISAAQKSVDPLIFWEHSLACAIVSRKLARSVGFNDPEKAYLAGLLHDLGYVVNLVLMPEEALAAIERGIRRGTFAGESEYEDLGFTHCQSGEVLATRWNFSSEIVEVIRCHHDPSAAVVNPALVTIVALADRLCRSLGLGLGYFETPDPAEDWQNEWAILAQHCPLARRMMWTDFVRDSEHYRTEVHELVKSMYQQVR